MGVDIIAFFDFLYLSVTDFERKTSCSGASRPRRHADISTGVNRDKLTNYAYLIHLISDSDH